MADEAPPIGEWLRRCQAARSSGQTIPLDSLFRQMLGHSEWWLSSSADDVWCSADAAPNGGEAMRCISGLELAHAIGEGVAALRLHFDKAAPPLECDATEAGHFCSFLGVAVVEALLERLHDGVELQTDEPFARLREFDSFYCLCAGGSSQVGGSDDRRAPLMMALAPDADGGRKLAAAFTAQDALQLFVVSREASTSDTELVSVRLSGKELFEQVQRSGDRLDGLVINPSGPGRPLALSSAVADLVLSS